MIIYKDDCTIERDDINTILYDSEGDVIFKVPKNIDDQDIWIMLRIANDFYKKGFVFGKWKQQIDTLNVLGIEKHDCLIEDLEERINKI